MHRVVEAPPAALRASATTMPITSTFAAAGLASTAIAPAVPSTATLVPLCVPGLPQ